MESPVAQWLEHPTRSRRVVGSNPIWSSDFFPSFHLMLKPYHVVISTKQQQQQQQNKNKPKKPVLVAMVCFPFAN